MEENKDINLLLGYARLGCEDELKLLIEEKRLNLDSADTICRTSLHNAAIGGHRGIVDYLLADGATVDSKIVSDNHRISGATPLAYAIKHGHTNIAEILIERGADTSVIVNKVNLLHIAIYSDNPRTIEFLLGKGFDVNQPSGMYNSTPLIFAIAEHKHKSFRFLLEKGANYRSTGHSDPLLYAVKKQGYAWCIEPLLKHVETREGKDGLLEYMSRKLTDSQSTALYLACLADNYPVARALIKCGADIKLKDTKGCTPHDLLKRSNAGRTILAETRMFLENQGQWY